MSLSQAKDSLFKLKEPSTSTGLSLSHNNAKGLSAKLCKALFKENAQASMLCTQDLIENGRVDGVYLSEVEEACNDQSKEQVEWAVKRLIDLLCNCYGDNVC